MITSDIVKKFIDCYNEFKYDGRLTIEQLVYAMDNFQKISFDIEDIVKVLNNQDFANYAQYNVMDFLNAVFNEHVYDLFLKERKEQKMCYWIINIEFYKILNIYRILILKANLLISTINGSLNEVIIKDFERTINIYVTDSVMNIKKCLDFLRRNKFTKELVFCTKPFRNLVKMDDFGRAIFQRIFPNIDPDEFVKIYETDSDDEEDDDEDGEELDPEIQTKLETVINNLARLNGGNNNNTLVDPIKRLVKEALRKAGIDIDLDSNTTITVGGKTILSPTHISSDNKGMTMSNMGNMGNVKSNTTTSTTMDAQTLQNMMNLQNMQSQMQNMQTQMQNQKVNTSKTTNVPKNASNATKATTNVPKKTTQIDDSKIVFSDYDREIEAILNGIGTSSAKTTKTTNTTNTTNVPNLSNVTKTLVPESKTSSLPVKTETRGRKTKATPVTQSNTEIPVTTTVNAPTKGRKTVKKNT